MGIENTKITEGQWKGWTKVHNFQGTECFRKDFKNKGTIIASKGMFYVYLTEPDGKFEKEFNTYKEALEFIEKTSQGPKASIRS